MSEKLFKTVAVSGGDYHYAQWPGDDATLLLVHGITASHMAWPRFVREFGHEHNLIAPDLRGRGKNAELPSPYGFDQHIDDLLRLMDAEALERVVWVGHSLGAYIGLDFAYHHADRIEALVLVDGGIALPLRDDKTPEEVIKVILGPALARLEKTFPSREAYQEFWQAHPAFQDPGAWDDDVLRRGQATDVHRATIANQHAAARAVDAERYDLRGGGTGAGATSAPTRRRRPDAAQPRF